MLKWPDSDNPVLLRTDFSDDAAWAALCKAAQAPSDEDFQAKIDCVSNRSFDGLAAEQVVALAHDCSSHSFAFMADRLTVTDPERPILVIDLAHETGRTFRVIPSQMWALENNLSLANMEYSQFADNVDTDGVSRVLICRPFLTLLRGTAMASLVRVLLPAVALSAALTAAPVAAVSPQNPYRTFNLSGINYGSMQWERAQREGRRVWPYYNAPSRTVTARSGAWVGAVAGGGGGVGTVVEAGGSRSVPRSTPRTFRRWRR